MGVSNLQDGGIHDANSIQAIGFGTRPELRSGGVCISNESYPRGYRRQLSSTPHLNGDRLRHIRHASEPRPLHCMQFVLFISLQGSHVPRGNAIHSNFRRCSLGSQYSEHRVVVAPGQERAEGRGVKNRDFISAESEQASTTREYLFLDNSALNSIVRVRGKEIIHRFAASNSIRSWRSA